MKNILSVTLIDKYFTKKKAAEKAAAALKAVEDEIRAKMAEAGIDRFDGLGYTIDLSPVWKDVFQPSTFRDSSPENAELYKSFCIHKATTRPFRITVKKD